MGFSLSLPVLIMGEIILVLLFCLFFLTLYLRKQRELAKKLLEKSNQLKNAFEQRQQEYESFFSGQGKGGEGAPAIPDYLRQGIEESLARYEKYTQAKLPKIDPNQAFNAKVAALRYFYLNAEKDAYEKKTNPANSWSLFEKKLAEIVRWFTKQLTPRQDVRHNRIRLLQEKIDQLKPFEAENKKLQRSLEQAKKRQAQLETYLRENKATISNLQKMLDSLRSLNPAGEHSAVSPGKDVEKYFGNSLDKVNSISDVASEKGHMLKSIIYEMNTYGDMNPEIRKKMEASLRMMEVELMKSDQYISNLKSQLKDAKLQATNYALMLSEHKHNDKVVIVGEVPAGEKHSMTSPVSLAPSDYYDQEKVLQEIRQLRENNKSQRSIIVKLETEITDLKESILSTGDETTRAAKQQEVQRLERMVKECEHCIETLESEVDNLYSQLQKHSVPNSDALEDESGDNRDAERLSQELEEMAKEMEKIIFQYRQTHSVNQFIYELINTTSIENVTNLLLQFLREFQAEAGFCMKYAKGVAEYLPAHRFNDNMRDLVKSFSIHDPVFYINEGTLFSGQRISLMLLPAEPGTKPLHESALTGLVKVIDDHLIHLDSQGQGKDRTEGMKSWADATKNHLADLEIQYAYQIEENKKTFNNFISEIREAYHLLDLKGSGLVLLDNAINEYEQRMYLLMSSGDIIDREISTLIDHIDNLPIS